MTARLFTKYLLIACLVALPLFTAAQARDYILDPIEEVVDMRAVAERKVEDEYGKRCPLVKVYTEIDRRELRFDVDLASVIEEVHSDIPGQIWIYISPGATRFTVQHLKFEETVAFAGGMRVGGVYKTTINYSEEASATAAADNDNGGQFFTLRVTPAVAELTIDNDDPISITNGTASRFLSYGEHTYSVSASLHQPAVGSFTIAQERVDHTVSLPPIYGYLSVASTPTAQVELNGIPVGTTPYTSQPMPFNTYTVRLSAAGYEDITRTVTLSKPSVTVEVNETLLSTSIPVTLTTSLDGATILVNGEAKGVGSWRGSLEKGEYLLTATKEGYRDSSQRITVSRTSPSTITIPAPTPIYGKLMVNASQLDIMVTLDGKPLGTAPNIFSNILVGSHTITYSGKGYQDKSEQITIEEGATAQATVTLAEAPKFVAPRGMVYVEGGTFQMGSTDISDATSVHSVTLSSFYIGKYEVTQAEWEAVMGDNPSYHKGDNKPVEKVTWYDCVAFCNAKSRAEGKEECYSINGTTVTLLSGKNGYRLPTEAEWEYAARGGNQSNGYTYAGSNTIGDVAWYYDNSSSTTHEIGTKQANELGIYDMSGNVYEWCWDWSSSYTSTSQTNPTGVTTGSSRVFRGGSYYGIARNCRSSNRACNTPTTRVDYLGLRLVCGEMNAVPEPEPVILDMVCVEGGTFQMGSTDGDNNESPVHAVTLSSFYIGKYEVTQAEWEAVMGDNPSYRKGGKKPVANVTWYDCVEFCNAKSRAEGKEECYEIDGTNVTLLSGKNGYRLPTEAEWEYAARGGNKSKGYIYAGSNNISSVAWYGEGSSGSTHEVGTKQANELGIYDMSGNVWEWCWDWYTSYASSSQTNPTGATTGSDRVNRGGGYYSTASNCRSSNRSRNTPANSRSYLGLRLVFCP